MPKQITQKQTMPKQIIKNFHTIHIILEEDL